ncbi:MAG TPA: hypothetical protein VE954_27300 [Oligoflexus sp.]|uniref:hypothetical protein n=1 Tax=Oligoflexus sp. TaxID=1971216 RepID=UPI002D6F9BFB|nr:hypothetical protein [Oligoflexus sp.]HYX36831.1 hypothetical protein [Oligoflexus sp.]
MKLLITLILSLAGFAGSLHAAEVVLQENLACTADINKWGYSSNCSCQGRTRYDQRVGYCIRGAYKPITVSGSIVAGLVAVGGETTGIALQTFDSPSVRYELVLQTKDFEKLSQLNGVPFEVVGDYIVLPGVEAAPRPAIIVKQLHWLD